MTNARESEQRGNSLLSSPWLWRGPLLAFYAFLFWQAYLATLNHWVSGFNISPVTELSGWNWRVNLFYPVYFLVTYPLHWLPVNAVPLAVNVFTLLCAVLTLVLLARSVSLLPHDRTHEQRQREISEDSRLSISTAMLPPLLAVAVCGLQTSFWERAVAGSSDIFDLLLFAYLIRWRRTGPWLRSCPVFSPR
jgi:Protein of unknown function (DUF2723)